MMMMMMKMKMKMLPSERWRAWSLVSVYDSTNDCSTDADDGIIDGDDDNDWKPNYIFSYLKNVSAL